jgi:hypothetical protein
VGSGAQHSQENIFLEQNVQITARCETARGFQVIGQHFKEMNTVLLLLEVFAFFQFPMR